MKKTYTPLRYPGGKSRLVKQFEIICKSNNRAKLQILSETKA